MMRNAIVAAAFALVLASPAKAADYLADVAPYDWTGVYGGVHAGFIQANVSVENRDLDFDRDFNGFAGGVLGGVNFQAGNVVFGLDMDFGGVAAGDGKDNVDGVRFEHGMDWVAHVRGRLGYAIDRLLIYAAGGLAVADFDVKANNGLDDGGHATGWSVGGGLEYAVTDNVLVRAEFLHDNYIDEKATVCDVTLVCSNFDVDFGDNIFRIGASWKFMSGMAF
jgi:outer membrane immunogenic protein